MRHPAPTETIGRTLGALFLSLVLLGCGDSPQEDAPEKPPEAEARKEDSDVDSGEFAAKVTAIRDADEWLLNITVPQEFPDQAKLKLVVVKSSNEELKLEYNTGLEPLRIPILGDTKSYEVILIDDQDRSYPMKAAIH